MKDSNTTMIILSVVVAVLLLIIVLGGIYYMMTVIWFVKTKSRESTPTHGDLIAMKNNQAYGRTAGGRVRGAGEERGGDNIMEGPREPEYEVIVA